MRRGLIIKVEELKSALLLYVVPETALVQGHDLLVRVWYIILICMHV